MCFDDEEKQDIRCEETQDGDFEFGIFARSFFFGGCGLGGVCRAKVRQSLRGGRFSRGN